MTGLLSPDIETLNERALDITAPRHGVEVRVDQTRKVVWVNVDGVCALRICRAPAIDVHVEEIGR